MIKSTRMDVVTTYKSIRNLSACVEQRGRVGMGGWVQFGTGEVGWGRRNRGRECRQSGYLLTFTDGITDGQSIGDSAGECATSLYRDPGLNPSVHLSVKSSEKNPRHHTVATFQKNYIIRRWYGRYIPMELIRRYIPTGIICRYIPIELEMELLPSAKITGENISSVIPLVFAGFLVVYYLLHEFSSNTQGLACEWRS
jgi:hypothetical protein